MTKSIASVGKSFNPTLVRRSFVYWMAPWKRRRPFQKVFMISTHLACKVGPSLSPCVGRRMWMTWRRRRKTARRRRAALTGRPSVAWHRHRKGEKIRRCESLRVINEAGVNLTLESACVQITHSFNLLSNRGVKVRNFEPLNVPNYFLASCFLL